MINLATQLAKLPQTSKHLAGLGWEEQNVAPLLFSGVLILVLVKTSIQIRDSLNPMGTSISSSFIDTYITVSNRIRQVNLYRTCFKI